MIPNPCHSKPRPTPETKLIVQDGYFTDPLAQQRGEPFVRMPRYVEIAHVASCACVYGPGNKDPRCGAFPELQLGPCPHLDLAENAPATVTPL